MHQRRAERTAMLFARSVFAFPVPFDPTVQPVIRID